MFLKLYTLDNFQLNHLGCLLKNFTVLINKNMWSREYVSENWESIFYFCIWELSILQFKNISLLIYLIITIPIGNSLSSCYYLPV